MPRILKRAGVAPAPKATPAKTIKKAAPKKVEKKAAPKKGKAKKLKVKLTTCLSCKGDRAFVKHDTRDMVRNENGRLMCKRCAGKDAAADDAPETEGTWFVVQVEPGKEGAVRKEILRRVKIENLEGQVRRVLSPSTLVERVGPRVGPVLAEGTVEGPPVRETYEKAKEAAHRAAAELYLKEQNDPDATVDDYLGMDAFPGLKIQKFPGRKAGTVDWKVREYSELETVRKVIKTRKFPGYMLVNMDWNETTAHLIKKTRYVWGVLLKPVVTGHNIKVTERKSRFATDGQNLGWRWRVVTPDGATTVAKGLAGDKAGAWAAAEKAKAKAEEFKPTAVKSREAAELLLAQKAVNQICKDKEEKDKAVVNLRVDDSVQVMAGAFRGCRATVIKVNRLSKTEVTVDLKAKVMGRDIVLTLQHHDVKRLTKGDR